MIHKIDKETVKRIVNLRQVQGLSFPIIGERFGISSTRAVQIFKRHQKKQQALNVKSESLHITNTKAFTSQKLQTLLICKKHDA